MITRRGLLSLLPVVAGTTAIRPVTSWVEVKPKEKEQPFKEGDQVLITEGLFPFCTVNHYKRFLDDNGSFDSFGHTVRAILPDGFAVLTHDSTSTPPYPEYYPWKRMRFCLLVHSDYLITVDEMVKQINNIITQT